jgi:hypothetical protein
MFGRAALTASAQLSFRPLAAKQGRELLVNFLALRNELFGEGDLVVNRKREADPIWRGVME